MPCGKRCQGTATYKIAKVNKKAKSFAINHKTGKITVEKKLKKGTYKVTVAVSTAGNQNYSKSVKNAVVKISVK